jgi:hypothetical protein
MTDTNGIDCIKTPYYVDVIMPCVVDAGVVRASFEHNNYHAQTPIIYASLSIHTSLLLVPSLHTRPPFHLRLFLYAPSSIWASIYGRTSIEIHLTLPYFVSTYIYNQRRNVKNILQHVILYLHKHVQYLNDNLTCLFVCHVNIGCIYLFVHL